MQRPKPGDTEEDLLRLQAEFLKSVNPTPQQSDKRKNEDKNNGPREARDVVDMEGVSTNPTSFSRPTPSKKPKVVFTTPESNPAVTEPASGIVNEDMEEMIDKKDTGFAAVLTNIIERDTRNQFVCAPAVSQQAFPSVLRNEDFTKSDAAKSSSSRAPRKKKSLFAQHIEAKSAKVFGVDRVAANCERASTSTLSKDKEMDGPCLVDGRGLSVSNSGTEALQIHEENLGKLKSMSEAEILEEQQRLLQSIDPKLLEYLKKKRQEKDKDSSKPSDDTAPTPSSFSVLKAKKNKGLEKKESDPHLPINPDKSWVHMDVVEKDKMEWMSELPPPQSLVSETGKPARFDLDGNLLAVDVDIPVHQGLHHHGEEPERAGYTLQELFILARSSNLQQRILSLHTLAKIMRKAKCGDLTSKTEGPILPVLLDGGLVLLLRWALDDSVEAVVYGAVDALHSLIWHPLEEEALDSHMLTFQGELAVALTPSSTLEKWSEPPELDEENKEEETDGDMMKRDVIEALVRRTEILTRFNFILSSMRPQALVVVQMTELLCRVARHSKNLAYEIIKSPGLLDKLIHQFLPTTWSVEDPHKPISDVCGFPVPRVLRLLRCLAQNGRNLAASLIAKYNLASVLLRYLAVDASQLNLPVVEASNLQNEALSLWSLFLSYGFTTQTFFDLYEVIIPLVGKVGEYWKVQGQPPELSGLRQHGNLVSTLERIVCATQRFENKEESFSHRMPVRWSHVISFYQPIKSFVVTSLQAIGTSYPMQKQDLSLPMTCLNFLATFYDMETKQTGEDCVPRLEDLESLSADCLKPFLTSHGLAVIKSHLCSYSNILSKWTCPAESSTMLPTLNLSRQPVSESGEPVEEEGDINIPILRHHSPFPFTVSLFRLVLAICRRHKSLASQLIPLLVEDPDILMYLKKTCQASAHLLGPSLWTRTENLTHYFWLKACILKPSSDMSLAHRVSLRLLGRLSKGDEFLVHDLMTSVVFSSLFISEGQEKQLAMEAMSNLTLSESLYLKSATQEDIDLSKSRLLKEAHGALATIRGHFLLALSGMEKDVIESRGRYHGNLEAVQTQAVCGDGESLMPLDWIYLPLIHVYNKSTQLKAVPGSETTNKDVAMVTSVLQWVYLLEVWRANEIRSVSLATRLSRVLCAFIAGNDMFLDKGVQKYLAGIFREMTQPHCLDRIDLEERVPGISSFYDLFQEFLEHYESVSFGDPVFGLYVLLPLQQRHSSLYRKAVWGERRKILRTLRVSLKQMLIPVENFLSPEEDDEELLTLYARALVGGAIQPDWAPVLYLVAVHHLNRFLFVTHDDGRQEVRERLWKVVAAHHEKHQAIIYYKSFNASLDDGLECYDTLPDNRQTVFNRHLQKK